jgi:pilus assembly protein CpaE
MNSVETKGNLDTSAREAFSAGRPLSLVSISLDKETLEVLKLFIQSFPLLKLRANLPDYRLDENESVLSWIGDPPPDVCLVDFDKDPQNAAIATERIHANAQETAVFAVSSQSQPDVIINAMRSGCSEYLTKPIDREQLLNAVARVGGRKREKKELYNAQVICFTGAKGGCGVTTLLTELGVLLARPYSKKTLVVDLHPDFGDAALYLGLTKYRYHAYELIESIQRLDAELLQSLVTHHPSGLDIVPASEEINPGRHFLPGAVTQTFNFLRSHYEYILVDLPAGLDEESLNVMHYSDYIYLVTVAEVAALRNVARYLDFLTRKEIPQGRIRVLLNRHHKTSLITEAQIEKAIQRKLFWKVPNQYPQVIKMITGGDPIAQLSNSEVMRNLNELAKTIATQPSTGKKKESQGLFGGLWSR